VAAVGVEADRSAAVCEPHAASRTPRAQAAIVPDVFTVAVRWPVVVFIDPPCVVV
jgi:hypothetical protein